MIQNFLNYFKKNKEIYDLESVIIINEKPTYNYFSLEWIYHKLESIIVVK